MSIYDDMADAFGAEMADVFGQGTVIYEHPGVPTGPAHNPTPGVPTPYTLSAAITGADAKYVQASEGKILATDLKITCAAFGVTPSASGTMTVDGREVQIIEIHQRPAAGTPVAWRIFCRA